MRRRDVIGFAASAALSCFGAAAKQSDRTRLIGMIMVNAEGDPEGPERVANFRQSLGSFGWKDGANASVEVRWHGGDLVRAKTYARELVDRSPDVIVVNGTQALAAVQQLTSSIPVVFVVVNDPVGGGFVQSLSRPGGNATGFSTFEPEIGGKWVETLTELTPHVQRVGVLIDPEFRGFFKLWRSIEAIAPSFGARAIPLHARGGAEIDGAIRQFSSEANGGLVVLPTPTNAAQRERIVRLASENRLPAIYPFSYYARQGGLMSYGFEPGDLFRRAAPYVARILDGEAPGNLPVEAPSKFEFVLNLKTAKALGLTIPPTILARVDEVIE